VTLARLSAALVAFTIELDDEFERAMAGGPWLVSWAMFANCMRYLDDRGLTVEQLERRARTPTNVDGMRRWGYVTVRDGVLRPTPAGRRAQEVWRPLPALVEARWGERFGAEPVAHLRDALRAATDRLDGDLPDCLPILGYGLFCRDRWTRGEPDAPPDLPALLSRVLLAAALGFERNSPVSLAVAANPLRVLGGDGVRGADLPRLTGTSQAAVAMAVGWLERHGLATIGRSGRFRVASLTPAGAKARAAAARRIAAIDARLAALGDALEPLTPMRPPDSDGWRAGARRPDTLPHFPMVLHRGGFPDGS
jgi:hypothetical protein